MSLLKYCAEGNLTEIKTILSRGRGVRTKVQTRDNHNWTCLHHAVKSGNVECIEYLLAITELDTTAETFEGETALHIACCIPNVSSEIISILLKANADLVNFVNNEEVDLLQCAIVQKRLDIVKLLVDNGAPVNKEDLDGDTPLHIAANEIQLDIIRYLLYETDCDPTICNEKEKTAAFLLFAKLSQKMIQNPPLTTDEIECFEELAQFTYSLLSINNPNGNEAELSDMINVWYRFNIPRNNLYMKIIKLFHVPPPREYFVQKILQSNIPSYHCLIIALLQKRNTDDLHHSSEVWSNFLCELFILFLSDELFFDEYISEVMSRGWSFPERNQASSFCAYITENGNSIEPQKLFSFLKVLILYEIDFDVFYRDCEQYLYPHIALNVFAPLVKFVIPTFPWNETINFLSFNYNYNESEDVLKDHKRSLASDKQYEVVSLKNLSRMCLRKYYFKNYTHYNAIKTMYTLNIPNQIRSFVCYNFCNFKF